MGLLSYIYAPPMIMIIFGAIVLVGSPNISISMETPRARDLVLTPNSQSETSAQLVIQSRGHQALIRELQFTADGRKLISVSDDKTIQIWNVPPDGRGVSLARMIRGQIGAGRAGSLYAAALSPADGTGQHRWLAVGGFLAGAEKDRYAIRLHDYASGEVMTLLQGHRDVINALVFSPNGRWLASSGKDQTVRIWDLNSLDGSHLTREPLVLTGHRDAIYDLAWGANGKRLASASDDKTVGLWNTDALERGRAFLIRYLQGHQEQVRTVAFHPDGQELISGGKDQTIRRWQPLDGKSLGIFAYAPNEIAALAFAPDGDMVVAGRMGGGESPKQITLYSYPKGHVAHVFKEHDNVVVAIAFHPNGQWIASAGGNNKKILLWEVGAGNVLSRLESKGRTVSAVGVSPDGSTISWGQLARYTHQNDQGPLTTYFDLTELKRIESSSTSPQMVRAVERMDKLKLKLEWGGPYNYPYRLHVQRGWRRLTTLERDATNGYRHSAYTFVAPIQSNESQTATPYILSGGLNGALVLYSVDGHVVARLMGHTGEIKAVAASPDGRWVVSGASDQTVMLWSLENLSELPGATMEPAITLFSTVEKSAADAAWIAWVPEGFFETSENGSDLVGFTVNQGVAKRAKYISMDQMFSEYYRPDLVRAKLRGALQKELQREGRTNERPEKRIATEGVHPFVRFLSHVPETVNDPTLTVSVMLCDQGGGVGKVEWRHEARIYRPKNYRKSALKSNVANCPTETVTTSKPQSEVHTVAINLNPGKNTISVAAYNQSNLNLSPSETLTVDYNAPPSPPPALHILAIGVNTYEHNRNLDLQYAVEDVERLRNDLLNVGKGTFRPGVAQVLQESKATRSHIENWFAKVKEEAIVKADDMFILILSGHGIVLDDQYYFIPANIPSLLKSSYDSIKGMIGQHGISEAEFIRWFNNLPTRQTAIVIDTCYSGSFFFLPTLSTKELEIKYRTGIQHLVRATGQIIFAATTAQAQAIEGYQNHGVFTYVFREALRYADRQSCGNNNNELSLGELYQYVYWRLPILSIEKFGKDYKQEPVVTIVDQGGYLIKPIGHVLPPGDIPNPLHHGRGQLCNDWDK